ncbi:MAG: transposase [Bacteroidetes bacterium]|nr:transposase [Bacteroidota bacterium]
MATNILQITKQFNTQRKCVSYLRKIRWGKTVKCPFCESKKVRVVDSERGAILL